MGEEVDERGRDGHAPDASGALGASLEQLASSHVERSTMSERVGWWLARGGITGWVGAHRWAAGGAAAAAFVLIAGAAAGVAFVASRPPPVASFRVVVSSAGDQGLRSLGQTDLVWANDYAVTGLDPGDADRVVGIVGPGLGSPTAPAQLITTSSQGVVRLGATLKCLASLWSSTPSSSYRARVQRMDAFGRLTEADVPVSDAGAWHRMVVRQCLLRLVEFDAQTARWGVSLGQGSRVVKISVDIHNPGQNPVWLSSASLGLGPDLTLTSAPTLLAPRAWTRWTTDLAVRNCRPAPHLEQFTLVDQNGMHVSHVGLPVSAAVTRSPTPADKQSAWLVTDNAAGALTYELTHVCA
jgi:hypothetical protein